MAPGTTECDVDAGDFPRGDGRGYHPPLAWQPRRAVAAACAVPRRGPEADTDTDREPGEERKAARGRTRSHAGADRAEILFRTQRAVARRVQAPETEAPVKPKRG